MKNILLYIWQLPQHIAGLIVWGILKAAGRVETVNWLYSEEFITIWVKPDIGVCLGKYIFLYVGEGSESLKHEYGHSRQSLYLGPLYLPVVGIASAVFNNLWDRLFHKKWDGKRRIKWYYSRYPEDWADRLGGVAR